MLKINFPITYDLYVQIHLGNSLPKYSPKPGVSLLTFRRWHNYYNKNFNYKKQQNLTFQKKASYGKLNFTQFLADAKTLNKNKTTIKPKPPRVKPYKPKGHSKVQIKTRKHNLDYYNIMNTTQPKKSKKEKKKKKLAKKLKKTNSLSGAGKRCCLMKQEPIL